jgi:hypothetical protein
MIPQMQRWTRGPRYSDEAKTLQTDEGGDCFAACIASILEVSIEGFPNFLAKVGEKTWWERWQDYLYENYRQRLLNWDKEDDGLPDVKHFAWWIAEVQPNNIPHAVVFYQEEMRHDPYPGRPPEFKYTLDEVKSAVAIYSIGTIFE